MRFWFASDGFSASSPINWVRGDVGGRWRAERQVCHHLACFRRFNRQVDRELQSPLHFTTRPCVSWDSGGERERKWRAPKNKQTTEIHRTWLLCLTRITDDVAWHQDPTQQSSLLPSSLQGDAVDGNRSQLKECGNAEAASPLFFFFFRYSMSSAYFLAHFKRRWWWKEIKVERERNPRVCATWPASFRPFIDAKTNREVALLLPMLFPNEKEELSLFSQWPIKLPRAKMGRMRAFDDPNHENVTLIADAAAARVNGTLEGEKKRESA